MNTEHQSKKDSLHRILEFPLIRLLLAGVIVFYLYISGHMFRAQFASQPILSTLIVLWMIGLTMFVYIKLIETIEHRKAVEFSSTGMGKEFGLGLLIGFGLFALCILTLMVLGIYRIEGFNNWGVLLGMIWMGLSSGFFEELLFRGIILRITQEYLGSWIGIAVSSLAFGLIHLSNPGATIQGVLFIAVEAGLLLAAAYILTGRLWLGMGIHMAWNYTQSAIFAGVGTSNPAEYGLVKGVVKGPELLTGGIYGMEFSIVGLVMMTSLGIIFLVLSYRRGKIKSPFWVKKS